MGQTITDKQRQRILGCREVQEVTAQHIILKDGHVVDPADFIVERQRARFIFKLQRCGCWRGRHEAGFHTAVAGTIDHYGNGSRKPNYAVPYEICRGRWTLEETVETGTTHLRPPQGGRIHVKPRV